VFIQYLVNMSKVSNVTPFNEQHGTLLFDGYIDESVHVLFE